MTRKTPMQSALYAKEPQELLENREHESALELLLIHQGLEQIDQGISIFNNALKLVAANARFTELLDFPTAFGKSGTTLETIFRYNAERGEYGPGDIDSLVQQRIELALQQKPHCFQRIRPDGTVLEVRGNQIEEYGFVTTYTDITERVRSAEALRFSRQRFQDMACAASDWFWELDANGKFTFISERFFTSVGILPNDILGKSRDEIAIPLDLQQEPEKWASYFEVINNRYPFRDFEYRFRGAKDKVYHLRVSGIPVYDGDDRFIGYRGTGTDVTLLKETEQALAASEKRLSTILESSIAGACISERKTGKILFSTPHLAELLHYTLDDLNSLHTNSLFIDEQTWTALISELRKEGQLINQESQLRRKNGTHFWGLVTLKTLTYENKACLLTWVYDISELKSNQEELARLANHDTLTGLPNRRHFQDQVSNALARAQRTGRQGALIYFDLDNFKPVNDQYGHDYGDWLLKESARRIQSIMRKNDLICRLGGDEFVALIQDIENLQEATIIAEKILDWLDLPFFYQEQEVSISASIGIVYFDGSEKDADSLIIKADRAMYQAKSEGKGRIHSAT
ncbi:MAG: diguanylate cyclase [Sedimenticola sp.]|nr:diguanylate cyclase [Sedimenticola sp.]